MANDSTIKRSENFLELRPPFFRMTAYLLSRYNLYERLYTQGGDDG